MIAKWSLTFALLKIRLLGLTQLLSSTLRANGFSSLPKCRFYRRHVIFRQRARIGAWISDGLVPLVQRLRDLQSALGGETEATVPFALQAREIIQLRRDLGARLFLL